MSENTATATATPETAKKQVTTTIVDDLSIKIGSVELPILHVHKPASMRKTSAGETKVIEEKNIYRAATPQAGQVGLVLLGLLTAAGDKTKQDLLLERIIGTYFTDMSVHGQVTKPDGSVIWDENVYAKALSNPAPARRAGTSIDDLLEQHGDILSLQAKVADLLLGLQQNPDAAPDFSTLSAALGRPITQLDQVYVLFSDAKRNLANIERAISEKRAAAAAAKLKKDQNKAAKEAASNAQPAPATAPTA